MADLSSALQSVLQVPGLQELLNSSITQQRQLAPLRTAVTQQAVNMLPNSAFSRPNIAAIPEANYTTPPSNGTDWTKVLSLLAAGLAGGGVLSKLANGGNNSGGNVSNIVDALKKLFAGKGGTVQGNKPFSGGALTGPQSNLNPFTWNPPDSGNGPGPRGDVSTSMNIAWPNEILNDPSFLNSLLTGPTDPSNNTGVGPGMQQYYGGGTTGDESDWGDE